MRRNAAVKAEPDENEARWQNATCPFCNCVATWDAGRKQLVSDCTHLRAFINGDALFTAESS